jgi:hypothetical protein
MDLFGPGWLRSPHLECEEPPSPPYGKFTPLDGSPPVILRDAKSLSWEQTAPEPWQYGPTSPVYYLQRHRVRGARLEWTGPVGFTDVHLGVVGRLDIFGCEYHYTAECATLDAIDCGGNLGGRIWSSARFIFACSPSVSANPQKPPVLRPDKPLPCGFKELPPEKPKRRPRAAKPKPVSWPALAYTFAREAIRFPG